MVRAARLRTPAETLQQTAAVVIRRRVAGLQPYRRTIPCQRLFGAPQLVRGPRAVVDCPAVVRDEGDGAVIVLKCCLILPLQMADRAVGGLLDTWHALLVH